MKPVLSEDMNAAYEQAIGFLYSFVDYERVSSWKYNNDAFDPTRSLALLHGLGDPHEKGRYVHVAGTNGKGSVVSMIASVLSLSGYRTGLYTSPHLLTFRERIRIDGRMISRDDVIKMVEQMRGPALGIENLTFFEVWTALAFLHFVTKSTDAAVMEVGLGGRLDSTNVITPEVSVITSVSRDHIGKLGNTLAEIAAEKAGIIKPGVPVISAPQKPEVMNVLSAAAAKTRSPLVTVGRDVFYEETAEGISYKGLKWNIPSCSTSMTGAFQHENTAVALAALEQLSERAFTIMPDKAVSGIARLHWQGRLQTLAEKPTVIVDGACNTGAMRAVAAHIATMKSRGKVIAVVGMCADKDIKAVLEIVAGISAAVITTQVKNPRALPAEEIASDLPDTVESIAISNPLEALEKAISLAGTEGLVLATGSLYLVGEIMRYYGLQPENIY